MLDETSSCPTTASARSRTPSPRASVLVSTNSQHGLGRLRAGRIDDGPVRRQLELARADLDAGQLPDHRVACRSSTTTTATISRWSARPVRAITKTIDEIASDSCTSGRIFLRNERGERPVFGSNRLLQDDPHFRDHVLFHELLPRRLRTWGGTSAPDRMRPPDREVVATETSCG